MPPWASAAIVCAWCRIRRLAAASISDRGGACHLASRSLRVELDASLAVIFAIAAIPCLPCSCSTRDRGRVTATEVRDQRNGVREPVRKDRFESFVTTRGRGEAGGLGLASHPALPQQPMAGALSCLDGAAHGALAETSGFGALLRLESPAQCADPTPTPEIDPTAATKVADPVPLAQRRRAGVLRRVETRQRFARTPHMSRAISAPLVTSCYYRGRGQPEFAAFRRHSPGRHKCESYRCVGAFSVWLGVAQFSVTERWRGRLSDMPRVGEERGARF